MKRPMLALSVALAVASPVLVGAQAPRPPAHDEHDHSQGVLTIVGEEAIREFRAASQRLQAAMAIVYTGDADRDFIASMIPHHQAAIDLARAVLKHGKDPEIRKLAQDIAAAQEKELAAMRAWLERRSR